MPSVIEIEAQLQGPGALFELGQEEVLGHPLKVFKKRLPSLRAVLQASAGHGDKECLLYEGRRITYAEHFRAAASVAKVLAEDYGVGRGDRVAILAANCPEWLVTFWAATSLGAVPVGLNGWWARDEILFGLDDCDPVLLVGDRRRLERISGASLEVPVVEIESDFAALWNRYADAALSDAPISEDDPACILYTSGTTGGAKGAVHSHRNIIALMGLQFFHGLRVAALAAAQNPDEAPSAGGTVLLVNTPLFHASGLYTGAVTMLMSGATTVWMSGRFDPVRVMETIEKEKVTNWGPMGTMAHRVVFHPEVGSYDLSSLRGIGSGGAPTSPELQERIREVFPEASHSLGLGYGLTESALATLIFGEELEARPHSVGRPLPTVEIEIRDEQGRALPAGVEGEICIRSPLVMLEYWRRPEESSACLLADGWLETGDWGRMEEGFLCINSRKRDLILRGAENVYPIEIEFRLEAHPDVQEVAVIGVDHPELGQVVKAVVVPEEGAALDPKELAQWVAETLAAFKVPSRWEFQREPLPRNAAGKVMKHVLMGEAQNPFIEE